MAIGMLVPAKHWVVHSFIDHIFVYHLHLGCTNKRSRKMEALQGDAIHVRGA